MNGKTTCIQLLKYFKTVYLFCNVKLSKELTGAANKGCKADILFLEIFLTLFLRGGIKLR